jgi:hypothetical protein
LNAISFLSAAAALIDPRDTLARTAGVVSKKVRLEMLFNIISSKKYFAVRQARRHDNRWLPYLLIKFAVQTTHCSLQKFS